MNIIGYIKKYGHRSFEQMPFNDVDALVLSEFCYVNFDHIAPSIKNIQKPFLRLSDIEVKNPIAFYYGSVDSRNNQRLVETMKASKRYGDAYIGATQNIFDGERNNQFFAMAILLGDGTAFLAFRGTDVTLFGWKENFHMAFKDVVPSQTQAAEYVAKFAEAFACPLRLGGHSKGGNLAFYAALAVKKDIQSRILDVYSFDGPGFREADEASPDVIPMYPKLKKFLTERDMIGVVYKTMSPTKIIKSNGLLFGGHDAFGWQVNSKKPEFLVAKRRTAFSKKIEGRVNAWLEDTPSEDKKLLCEYVFQVFKTANVVYDLPFVLIWSLPYSAILLQEYEEEERKRIVKLVKTVVSVFLDGKTPKKKLTKKDGHERKTT